MKILFVPTLGKGFGHIKRGLLIISQLQLLDKNSEISIIIDNNILPFIDTSNLNVIVLPFRCNNIFQEITHSNSFINNTQYQKLVSSFINNIKPDVVVYDFVISEPIFQLVENYGGKNVLILREQRQKYFDYLISSGLLDYFEKILIPHNYKYFNLNDYSYNNKTVNVGPIFDRTINYDRQSIRSKFNILEKDKYEVIRGYLGMAVQYGDKTEAIPVIQDTRNLEYQVTLAIKKVTDQINAVIGFVTSNLTLSAETEISVAYGKIRELYEVINVDLSIDTDIPLEINTLVIAGPKEGFSEDQLKAIDSFVMRGGSLLILVDGVKVEDGLMASNNITGMDDLLLNYGVKLNHDLVLDLSSAMASFTQGFITFSSNYPFWPKVLRDGFDQDNVSVAKLESVVLPWVSSIEIDENKIEDSNISYLVKTTDRKSVV